ncbi:MAG TPA: rhodanese-like domain-containing protein [Acidimicrobiia bacterium]
MTQVLAFTDEGFGHTSHLVDLGDGSALVVDPARFPTREVAAAGGRGLRLAYTADTHTHADYVSGGPALGAGGAEFLAPAAASLEMPHRGVADDEVVELAPAMRLRAIPTPGHTPDHLAYLLEERGAPVALFSGGSLMAGTVGRTDLLGDDRRQELARALYRSLRDRILVLPDELVVYPTHGAGSFCSAPVASSRSTTIGRERATNPMLRVRTEDEFVERLIAQSGTVPTYFSRLPELNRRGPRVFAALPSLPRLSPADARHRVEAGARVVDTRPVTAFAAGHVRGAVSIALRPNFATWFGWLLSPDDEVIFVLDEDQDRADLVRQCLTVGFEHLAGEVEGGMDAWRADDLPVDTIEIVDAADVDGAVLDVRQVAEYRGGHVPGARNVELGAIGDERFPDEPVTVMCGHGERAATAASVLRRRGARDVAVLLGGPDAWALQHGVALVTGP